MASETVIAVLLTKLATSLAPATVYFHAVLKASRVFSVTSTTKFLAALAAATVASATVSTV